MKNKSDKYNFLEYFLCDDYFLSQVAWQNEQGSSESMRIDYFEFEEDCNYDID